MASRQYQQVGGRIEPLWPFHRADKTNPIGNPEPTSEPTKHLLASVAPRHEQPKVASVPGEYAQRGEDTVEPLAPKVTANKEKHAILPTQPELSPDRGGQLHPIARVKSLQVDPIREHTHRPGSTAIRLDQLPSGLLRRDHDTAAGSEGCPLMPEQKSMSRRETQSKPGPEPLRLTNQLQPPSMATSTTAIDIARAGPPKVNNQIVVGAMGRDLCCEKESDGPQEGTGATGKQWPQADTFFHRQAMVMAGTENINLMTTLSQAPSEAIEHSLGATITAVPLVDKSKLHRDTSLRSCIASAYLRCTLSAPTHATVQPRRPSSQARARRSFLA